MILALIGDIHLDEKSPRFAHTLDVLDYVIDDALAQGATHFALLGDLFEQNPTGTEYAALLDRVHRMRADDREVIVILGNHEAYASLAFWHHLGVRVAWDEIAIVNTDEARILAIPYPRRGKPPVDDLEDDGTIQGSMKAAADRIARLIADYRHAVKPTIVLAHFTIQGMTTLDTDFEQHQATEVIVPRAAFEGCALAAVGHIHKAQNWNGGWHPTACNECGADPMGAHMEGCGDYGHELRGWRYDMSGEGPALVGTGSLIRHSFAEKDDPKSYTLVDIHDGHTTWTRRLVPARPQIVETMDWQPSPSANAVAANILAMRAPGHEVKLTVRIAEDLVSSFDASVFQVVREQAALFVLDRETVTSARTRAPEIHAAHTLPELLAAWLAATGTELSERSARLAEKLGEVEG